MIFFLLFLSLHFIIDIEIQATSKQISLFNTSRHINPIDDSETIMLSIRATGGPNYYGEYPILYIRSTENEIDLFIDWKTYIGIKGPYVEYRIDKQPSVGSLWGISNDGTKTFYPKNWYVLKGVATFYPEVPVEELIKQMIEAKQFVVQTKPHMESNKIIIFDITDLKKHVVELGFLSIKNPIPDHIKKQIKEYNKDIWVID